MPMLRLFRSAVHTDSACHAVNHFLRNAFARKRMRPLACAIQAVLLGMAACGMTPLRAQHAGNATDPAKPMQTLAPITVNPRNNDLPPAYAGDQVAQGSGLGLLGQQDFMDTPFSTTGYTETYITNVQGHTIASVIARTDASIYSDQSRSVFETFIVRGFPMMGVNDISFNGLTGMAPFMRGSTEMLERIEVQKGPSATLNGMSPDGSVGGTINLISKRAGDAPLLRLSNTYESDAQFGAHVDMGQRFGERKQFGIRFNGVVRDGDTAVKRQKHGMALGALALDWRGERVRLSADVYRQHEQMDGINYRGITGFDAAVTRMPDPMDGEYNLAPAWAFNTNNTTTGMARVEWDVTDTVTAYAAYGRREGTYDAVVAPSTLQDDTGTLRTTFGAQYNRQIAHSGQVGLNGEFATGAVKHAWALAATSYKNRSGLSRAPSPPRFSNLYALDHGTAPVFTAITKHPAMASGARLRGVALADRMSVLQDRVQLTLGIRRQSVQSHTATTRYASSAWSPMVTILVKPLQDLSVYANYIQGLSSGGTAPAGAANAFEPLPPLKTKQHELGMKMDWGRFSTTAALFQITRPNAFTDPVTNIYAASGEQRNRGVEFNVFGEFLSGLRLMGGASFIKANLRRQANPAINGKQATHVPKFIARFGAEYDLTALAGVTLTGHFNHVGKYHPTADNRFATSAYQTVDIGARYATRISGKPVTLRVSIDNVFNKAYWASTGSGTVLGAPRIFMLSTSIDF